MEVLISWSGNQSRLGATVLYEWLADVIPGIRPWISTTDIAVGTAWFESLMKQLEVTSVCVICLTPENLRSPWLYFEAGAIAGKRADAKVCSYLIGVPGSQLMAGPLSPFQWAEATKDGTWSLVRTINTSLPIPHHEAVLQGLYDTKWPSLKRRLDKVLAEYDPAASAAVETQALKQVYRLSEEAQVLLSEAAADAHGIVMMARTSAGLHVQTNGKELNTRSGPREDAAWQSAVRELLGGGLLESRGHKGEVFSLSAEGYRVADELRAKKEYTAARALAGKA